MNRTVLGFITLLAVVGMTGCSMVKGLGEDVSTVGNWITKGSTHVEESIKKNPPGSGMEK